MKKPMTQEQRDISFTISTPGFKHLDDALKVEEATLMRKLRRGALAEVENVRGQLIMAEKVRKFLGQKLMSIDEAMVAGDNFEKQLTELNLR